MSNEMTPEAAAQWAQELQDRSDENFELEQEDRMCGGRPAASESEAVREWVHNVGIERPHVPWLVSNYDTYEKNPYYVGPPVPHPEDAADDEYRETIAIKEDAETSREVAQRDDSDDDDIPF